jgi:hypothetical protein
MEMHSPVLVGPWRADVVARRCSALNRANSAADSEVDFHTELDVPRRTYRVQRSETEATASSAERRRQIRDLAGSVEGGRIVKIPSSFVTVGKDVPRSLSRTITDAPATAAPLTSVTLPVMLALASWPYTGATTIDNAQVSKANARARYRPALKQTRTTEFDIQKYPPVQSTVTARLCVGFVVRLKV